MAEENFIKEKIKDFKKEKDYLTKEIRQRVLTYVIAAFGFVAGLAWNEAIKALIEELFPLAPNTLLAKFIYAVLVTLVVVLVTVYLIRFLKKEE